MATEAPARKMSLVTSGPARHWVLPSLGSGDNLHCFIHCPVQEDWHLEGLAWHNSFHRRKAPRSLEELLSSEDKPLLGTRLEACILWVHKSTQEPNSAVSCPALARHHSTEKDKVRNSPSHGNHTLWFLTAVITAKTASKREGRKENSIPDLTVNWGVQGKTHTQGSHWWPD